MSTDDPDADDLPPAVRETLDSLGGALGDIAELDKEQLSETIGLLETLGHDQAAGILRSRREVLKGAGAATGLGIAGLAGATATGGARAQSDTETGTIGNGNQDADLQDVSAESVNADEEMNKSAVLATTENGLTAYWLEDYSTAGDALATAVSDTSGAAEYALPRGKIPMSDTLTIPSGNNKNTGLLGRGATGEGGDSSSGTVLSFTTLDTGNGVEATGTGAGDSIRGLRLKDLSIYGPPTYGVLLRYLLFTGTVENVVIRSAGASGFRFDENYGMEYRNLESRFHGDNGFLSGKANGETYTSCRAQGNTDGSALGGFKFNSGDGITLDGCVAEGHTGGYGVNIGSPCEGVVINGGYYENNSRDIRVYGKHVTINSPILSGNNTCHIDLQGAEDVTINSPFFRGNPTFDVIMRDNANDVQLNIPRDATVSALTLYGIYDVWWPRNPTWNGEVDVSPSGSTYTAIFNTAFTEKPNIDVTPEGAAFQSVTNWRTQSIDGASRYTAVDLTFDATPTTLTWSAE